MMLQKSAPARRSGGGVLVVVGLLGIAAAVVVLVAKPFHPFGPVEPTPTSTAVEPALSKPIRPAPRRTGPRYVLLAVTFSPTTRRDPVDVTWQVSGSASVPTLHLHESPWPHIVQLQPGQEVRLQARQRAAGRLDCYISSLGGMLGDVDHAGTTEVGTVACSTDGKAIPAGGLG